MVKYLRWGDPLPSGNTAFSYVVGAAGYLQNYRSDDAIPYADVVDLLRTTTRDQLCEALTTRLQTRADEASVVVDKLLQEKAQGMWESADIRNQKDKLWNPDIS